MIFTRNNKTVCVIEAPLDFSGKAGKETLYLNRMKAACEKIIELIDKRNQKEVSFHGASFSTKPDFAPGVNEEIPIGMRIVFEQK